MPILGKEENGRDATAAIDTQVLNQFTVYLTLNKAQIDLGRVALGNALNERTLLDAVTAPDAAIDQNLYLSHKATK